MRWKVSSRSSKSWPNSNTSRAERRRWSTLMVRSLRWLFSFSFNLLALKSTDINSNNLARDDTGALSSWKAERRRDDVLCERERRRERKVMYGYLW